MLKNKAIKSILMAILILRTPSLQAYKDVKDHPDKKVTITSAETRIINAPNDYKFFISFWVQYTTRTYIRQMSSGDRFVIPMKSLTTRCKVMEPGMWTFYLLAYEIDQKEGSSYVYKLNSLTPQRQSLVLPENCQKGDDPLCTCPGHPEMNFDSIFKDAVTVVSGASHLFDLSQFDGVGGRPVVKNVMSGVADYKGNLPVVSCNTMAELMKGPMKEINEISFMNMDYDNAKEYLFGYSDDVLYNSFNKFGVRVYHDSLVSLGRHKIFSDNKDENELKIKNFCFSLSFLGLDTLKKENKMMKVKIEMALNNNPQTSATDYLVKETLVLVLSLY